MAKAFQLDGEEDVCHWVNDKGLVCVDLYAKALHIFDLRNSGRGWDYYRMQQVCDGAYVHHATLVGHRSVMIVPHLSLLWKLTPLIAYNVYFDIKVMHNVKVKGYLGPLKDSDTDRYSQPEVQLSPGNKQVFLGSFVSASSKYNGIMARIYISSIQSKTELVFRRLTLLPAEAMSSLQGHLQQPEVMNQVVTTGEHGHGCTCGQSSEDVHYYFDDKGRACVDMYAKALNILNGNNPDCWRYDILDLEDGDYVHQAELVSDRSLEVKAQHSMVCNLTPKIPYNVFFDIKLMHVARGFGWIKVIFELTDRKGDIKRLTPYQIYPGNTSVFVGQFIVNPKLPNVINVKMYNFNGYEKSGLIVRRVMIRPLGT